MNTNNRRQTFNIFELIRIENKPESLEEHDNLTVDTNILKKMPKKLKHYRKIRKVNLLEGIMENPEEFAMVKDRMKQFRNLQILNICNADIDINYLNCKHLDQLPVKIHHITPIFQTDYLKQALENCRTLRKFSYRLGYLSTACMKILTRNPIEHMALINVFIEEKQGFLEQLSQLKDLKHITMEGDINMAQKYLLSNENETLKSIESLEICAVNGLNYKNLKFCKSLITLKLHFLHLKNTHCILPHLSKMPALKKITLCKHKIRAFEYKLPSESDLLQNSKNFTSFLLNMMDQKVEIFFNTAETQNYVISCLYGINVLRLCNNEFTYLTNKSNIYEEIV